MAVVSALIGGFAGFVTFVGALVFSDASVGQALGLYFAAGMTTFAALLSFGLVVSYRETANHTNMAQKSIADDAGAEPQPAG